MIGPQQFRCVPSNGAYPYMGRPHELFVSAAVDSSNVGQLNRPGFMVWRLYATLRGAGNGSSTWSITEPHHQSLAPRCSLRTERIRAARRCGSAADHWSLIEGERPRQLRIHAGAAQRLAHELQPPRAGDHGRRQGPRSATSHPDDARARARSSGGTCRCTNRRWRMTRTRTRRPMRAAVNASVCWCCHTRQPGIRHR